MFDAVLNRHVKTPTRWGRGMIAAAVLHGITAGAVLIVSVRAHKHKDEAPTVTFFEAVPPPPPPPPPPPAGGGGAHVEKKPKVEKKIEHKPDTIVESKKKEVIPDPEPAKTESTAKPEPGGQAGGVEGGVQGGVVGGVVGGTLGGTPGGQLGGKPGGTGVVPFGEGMTRPSPLSPDEIQYTREAREAKTSGVMIVKCTIQLDGSVSNCRIIKGVPLMDGPVLAALSKHKGTPVMFQGHPVSVEYTYTIRLKMPD